MKAYRRFMGILVLFALLIVGPAGSLLGQNQNAQGDRGHFRMGFWSSLTQEQRQTVHSTVMKMREEGASREEIHNAMAEMLKGYGIELPEHWGEGFPGRPRRFLSQLTAEQRKAVREKMKEVRQQGVTPEEIHAAVAEMLKGYGIDLPEDWKGPHGPGDFGPGPGSFWKELTDEKREVVREKIKELQSQGATRDEIHAAVAEMLKGCGVDLPEHWGEGFPHGPRGRFLSQLTTEQRAALREKVKEMRDQGASREEIRTAVAEMLKGYGIEPPEHWGEGFPGGRRRFLSQLTDEQRKAVEEKVKEMRDQGASREEIRTAVAEMLKGYGVELPESKASISSQTQQNGLQITAQSSPNPFNPETQITYTLSAPEEVRVWVYNVAGQVIHTFDEGHRPAGSYNLRWDGCNESGNLAASGIYFYRIEAGPYAVTGRMVLLR